MKLNLLRSYAAEKANAQDHYIQRAQAGSHSGHRTQLFQLLGVLLQSKHYMRRRQCKIYVANSF